MTRRMRTVSGSGYYHVVVKGNGSQLLFEDDNDRSAFLRMLSKASKTHEVDIIAWCLMGNHVHLLLCDENQKLSVAMHDLLTSYAMRYNNKTGHRGYVFEDRFYSYPIEGDSYLLAAVRYIHINPLKDFGIAPADYRWSSYHEYLGERVICNTSMVLNMLGGREGFVAMMSDESIAPYVPRFARRVREEDAIEVARMLLGGMEPGDVKSLPKADRDEKITALLAGGLSIRQIERLTGIGRSIIGRIDKRRV